MGNTYPNHNGNYYYRNHTLYHIGTLDPLVSSAVKVKLGYGALTKEEHGRVQRRPHELLLFPRIHRNIFLSRRKLRYEAVRDVFLRFWENLVSGGGLKESHAEPRPPTSGLWMSA